MQQFLRLTLQLTVTGKAGEGNRFGIPSVGCKNRDDLELERGLTKLASNLLMILSMIMAKYNNQNTTAATQSRIFYKKLHRQAAIILLTGPGQGLD